MFLIGPEVAVVAAPLFEPKLLNSSGVLKWLEPMDSIGSFWQCIVDAVGIAIGALGCSGDIEARWEWDFIDCSTGLGSFLLLPESEKWGWGDG